MLDVNLSKLQEMVKDRETWRAAAHGVTELDTSERLNNKYNQLCRDPAVGVRNAGEA